MIRDKIEAKRKKRPRQTTVTVRNEAQTEKDEIDMEASSVVDGHAVTWGAEDTEGVPNVYVFGSPGSGFVIICKDPDLAFHQQAKYCEKP